MTTEIQRGQRQTTLGARGAGLLVGGAVLLMLAGAFPGISRIVVLPALLLVPGYSLLLLLGRPASMRGLSTAVPVSLVLAVCASLLLDVVGLRLDAVSLGSVLGSASALFVAGSYGVEARVVRRRAPADDRRPKSRAVASPGEG